MSTAQEHAETVVGKQVYLDHGQCSFFEASYFDATSTAIAASTLLQSKDYDQEHRDLLKPLGSATVCLDRTGDDAPGWYTITKVFPPMFGWR